MSLAFIPDTSKPVLPAYIKKVEPQEVPVQVVNTPPALNTEIDFDLLDEEEWLAARGLKYENFGSGYFTGSGHIVGDDDTDDIPNFDKNDELEFDSAAELMIEYRYLSWLMSKLVDGITEWGNAVGGVPEHIHSHYAEAWDFLYDGVDEDDDDDFDAPFNAQNIKH